MRAASIPAIVQNMHGQRVSPSTLFDGLLERLEWTGTCLSVESQVVREFVDPIYEKGYAYQLLSGGNGRVDQQERVETSEIPMIHIQVASQGFPCNLTAAIVLDCV